ncbi:hypothetical protein LDENG_00014130 [Lucifuga dentata]|nr:hypothetical protein LDENG_00014130 [Lucifuga dentata]
MQINSETQKRQRTQESKSSMLRHSDEFKDWRPSDGSMSPTQDVKRPIRRVRSPSRPWACQSPSDKSRFGGRFCKPRFLREEHSFWKPKLAIQKHYRFNPRSYFHRNDRFQLKIQHTALRERKRERVREWEWEQKRDVERYEQRESCDVNLSLKEDIATRRYFFSRSTSSRDKDKQFSQVSQSERNQSRERDHKTSKSKERERSRDRQLSSSAIQEAARNRAIQQKRKEIEKVYYQESEMFHLVVKMLIKKDPSLERPIQSSLQENLRDIGVRCVEAMEKFIQEYDSRELSY